MFLTVYRDVLNFESDLARPAHLFSDVCSFLDAPEHSIVFRKLKEAINWQKEAENISWPYDLDLKNNSFPHHMKFDINRHSVFRRENFGECKSTERQTIDNLRLPIIKAQPHEICLQST